MDTDTGNDMTRVWRIIADSREFVVIGEIREKSFCPCSSVHSSDWLSEFPGLVCVPHRPDASISRHRQRRAAADSSRCKMRRMHRLSFLRANACSQMRSTRQPRERRTRVTSRSRALFAANFFRQNAPLFFGFVACCGQPCQKHPSTKIASLSLGKTKSGRTRKSSPSPRWGEGRGEVLLRVPRSALRICSCRRQPVIPCARKIRIRASSVARFPCPRIRDITCERLALVKTSGMGFF